MSRKDGTLLRRGGRLIRFHPACRPLQPPVKIALSIFLPFLRFANNSAMATGSAFSKSPDKIWSFNPSTTGNILVTIF